MRGDDFPQFARNGLCNRCKENKLWFCQSEQLCADFQAEIRRQKQGFDNMVNQVSEWPEPDYLRD